jgi:hypothetical protein
MVMTYGTWILAAAIIVAVVYALRSIFRSQASPEFEAGSVSQSWLIEHRATNGDRFS